ncbi:glycoside hydrolase family protein [Yersinia frederiksenii]|nr:glycoside hydrolase family protein [Yersinia frederiksenii]
MSPVNTESSKSQAIFTVSDANYAVMALTMFDSVREHYPESDLFLFIVGKGSIDRIDNGINVVYIEDILDEVDLNQRITYYLQVELATSLRPHCFEYIFLKNYNNAIYLDPDLYIFRRMTEVDELLYNGASGVVTPHSLKTVRSNVAIEGDETFLKCGVFNLGFLALSYTSETLKMLSWWKDKLKWQCVADTRKSLFVDQKWLDLLPTYFDGFEILKSPLYNLAPWNSEHYSVISDLHGKYYIDDFDNPIAFIHFSGVKRASNHFAYLSEAREFYLKELKKREFMKLGFINYELIFKPKNINLDKICIFLYKDYINLKKDITSNPLVDWGFYDYLISMDSETNLPIYIRKLFDIFPDILIGYVNFGGKLDFDSLIKWMKNGFNYDGVVNLGTMIELKNASGTSGSYECQNLEGGYRYNLLGLSSYYQPSYYSAVSSLIDTRNTSVSNDSKVIKKITFESDRIEIRKGQVSICLPKINDADFTFDSSFIKNKDYTEIWVPNVNIQRNLKESLGIENVAVMPYPVIKPIYEVKEVNLPNNKFIVLMNHDFSRNFEQQNPMVSIAAFQEAFRDNHNVLFICYLFNVDKSECYENLVSAINNEPKAILITDDSDANSYYSYLHYAHCLISLHKNNHSGYRVAEALSLGKYVLANGANGNYEYMNSDNGFIIEEPSIKGIVIDAAEVLKSIFSDENILVSKNINAIRFIQKHFSPNTIGFMMEARIDELSNNGINIIPKLTLALNIKLARPESSLRKLIKKIPYTVSVYRKIKGLNNIESSDSQKITKPINQLESIIKILLKNVHRPEYLE